MTIQTLPSPLLSPLEWLVIQAELPADEMPGFLAYLQSVERGEAMLHHPDSPPYRLTPKATRRQQTNFGRTVN